MIAVVVRENGGAPQRHEFDQADISIGSARNNDLVIGSDDVLTSAVSLRHARLVFRDGRMIIVDLRSDTGTLINERRLTNPLVIRSTDQIKIGNFVLQAGSVSAWPDDADATPIVDATEIRLLAEIGAGDDVARSVYADWLEEHGRPDRAELLRLVQAHAAAPAGARDEIWNRIRDMASVIEPRWLLRVARPRLLCREDYCPGWTGLDRTTRGHIRSCRMCARSVIYCVRRLDLGTEPELGNQVAIDLAVENPD